MQELIPNRALGGIPQKFPDLATAQKVNIDFPYAAAQAFISLLGPELRSKNAKFKFLYVSGKAADRDVEKQHRWFHDARHIKVTSLSLWNVHLLTRINKRG
jgi:hypothetical protein